VAEANPVRILIALFLTGALALVAYQTGGGNAGALAALSAGLSALGAIFFWTKPDVPSPPIVRPTEDDPEPALLAAISEPVLITNDNRVRFANNAALALLGNHIIGEDIRLAIRHPAAPAQFAPDAADGSIELVGVGGRDKHVELSVATITPGKRLVHLIDRGARQAVERARVDFVANASHELRTPLAAILGFIETLADEKTGADPTIRTRFLEVMDKEARRMQRLIDDLISLSRIESEKHLLPDETVSLSAIVREVTGELRDLHRLDANRLHPVLPLDEALITGDRPQLSQIIHNLVGNALKYGRPDSTVCIKVEQDAALVRLTVADEGDGIAEEHLPRLTQRFYRVDSGRSRTMGGTGLGLAIVKHIVERHRGRLEINSTVGVGTTVIVSFPAPPQSAVTEPSPN
jgi:two-component system, OmpR family, phosphate regulon sensor histidine kinase PhoR